MRKKLFQYASFKILQEKIVPKLFSLVTSGVFLFQSFNRVEIVDFGTSRASVISLKAKSVPGSVASDENIAFK